MKKTLFLAFLVISSVFAIASVSANLLDIFGKKVQLGPVDVGVEIENSPPEVIKFFLIPSQVGPQTQQPFTATIVPGVGGGGEWYAGFVAQDVNGASDLATGIPVSNAWTEIRAPSSSIAPSIIRQGIAYAGYSCTEPLLAGICTNPSLQRIYLSQGIYSSSDPPSTTATISGVWIMRASVTDSGGLTSPIYSTPSADPTNQGLRINVVSAPYIETSGVNFNSLTLTGTNQIASSPITLSNYGNVALNTITITATDLTGTNPTNPSAVLSVSGFSASGLNGGIPDASCNVPSQAASLAGESSIIIPNGALVYTAAGPTTDRENIYVCARTLSFSGPSSATYGGTWDVTASSGTGSV